MRRKVRSGKVTEVTQFYAGEKKPRRTRGRGTSSAAKKERNMLDATRRLARTLNCNVTNSWILLTLSYADEALPGSLGEACRNVQNFIRRLQSRGVKFEGVWITADKDSHTGELVRLHHHIVMSGAGILLKFHRGKFRSAWAGPDSVKDIWGLGGINAKPVDDLEDYTPLAVYLSHQAVGGDDVKKWHTSRGLKKPEIISEEPVEVAEALRAPGGADVMEISEFDAEFGTHYIRYIAKPGRKRSAKKAASAPAPAKVKTQGGGGC